MHVYTYRFFRHGAEWLHKHINGVGKHINGVGDTVSTPFSLG